MQLAFPAHVADLMPQHHEIPDQFHDSRNTWVQFQRKWFFSGLPADTAFTLREGIDGPTAVRHLQAIQRSFEPKHEHKEAAVAYLASLWFESVTADGVTYGGES